jgi:hypothetical protein
MASRFWQRIAIAVAAAASVATSQLPEGWNVSGGGTFEATLLDAQHTQVKYAIHAEVSGPGPYTDLAGLITATVRAQQLGMFDNAIQLRITLRSTTNPEVEAGIAELTLPNITPELGANLFAWTHCTTPPCAEDFEVIVETIGTGAPALDLTGGVRVDANGENYDLEATTQVTVTTSLVP